MINGQEGANFAGINVIQDLVDMYLSVKIRKNEEIDKFNDKKLEEERAELLEDNPSACTLIGYIKSSIEILMALKYENTVGGKTCPKCKKGFKDIPQQQKQKPLNDSSEVVIGDVNSSKKFEKSEAA